MNADYSLFLRRFFLLGTTVLLAVLAFNILIDVYQAFDTPTWSGVNAEKHGADRHARIAKAYALRHFRPQAVILGSSRAESAFDPAHPYFAGLRTYNLAFPGASLYEQYRYLQHATAVGVVMKVLVTVDFFQFLGATQWVSDDFDESRLALDADGRPAAYPWRDVARLALSGSALHDSWRSLRDQRRKPSIYRVDGYRDDSGDVPEMLKKPGGQRAEFLQSERGYAETYALRRNLVRDTHAIQRSAYDDFRRMLEWAREHGSAVVFVIPAVHARHLELIRQLGLWPQFEAWKRALVKIAGETSGAERCRIWDFSVYDAVSGESLPPAGSAMRWWRESSHASRAAGKAMLDRMAGLASPSAGTCLSGAGIDAWLQHVNSAGEIWRGAHAADVAEVAQIIQQSAARQNLAGTKRKD